VTVAADVSDTEAIAGICALIVGHAVCRMLKIVVHPHRRACP